ncbi:hypothetical protein DSO57_1004327 [Entomophthora muscae]|uniref:Uncharacterized protein n=1 Tax=Entomophthora muscae TaxID=34485 RepID=A0ACC2SL81_9FUNG|nr:hypothetical protein DSO57_1004327 [Entomophthora muscae]
MKIILLVLGILSFIGCAKSLSGFTYSTILKSGCKRRSQLVKELRIINRRTKHIRIYGNDCNQVQRIISVIIRHRLRLRVLVGIWTRDNKLKQESNRLVRLLRRKRSYKKYISGVVVGNEDVFNGVPSGVVAGNIRSVRAKFRRNGLGRIAISTAEAGHKWSSDLIAASAVVYANIYSFFGQANGNMNQAAQSIVIQALELQKRARKKVVISETGWPSQGNFAGTQYAAPSLANQARFLGSFICNARKHKVKFYLHEPFDSNWKGTPSSIEQHFGILNRNGRFKTRFRTTGVC